MKTVIDLEGNEIEVSDDTVVRTGKGGVHYLLTPDEQAEYDARQTEASNDKPMEDWRTQMAATDILSRTLEDIIDVLTQSQRDSLAPETLGKYTNKKLIRSQKPQ